MIRTKLYLILLCLSMLTRTLAVDKQWTVADGLPTGEVHQIVELPNGQMLVNCEGVFCLSDGKSFQTVPCNYSLAYRMPHYQSGYGQQWQGDSLLWLHDFYRIYLFDARTRSFRYDIGKRLTKNLQNSFTPSSAIVTDRQGGQWKGTLQNGITYHSPQRQAAERIEGNHPLIDLARSTTDSHGS
ncbi:MAG: AraC family transcriptional regulator, partial [Prevotella sp.]|nr:AraC family transcriptional regulator [Prevotella sp.]